MHKLTILFRQPANETAFEQSYTQILALMEQLPGLRRRQACMVLGSPAGRSQYHRILELYFDDSEALDKALLSEAGRMAGKALMTVAKDAELLFAEVFEE
jgi:uncharacterized protein (TIGR02118 family)